MASSGGPMPLPEDKNMGTVLLILTSVLIFFTITTTVLRLWARYMRGLIGWDDYTIGVCCLLAIGRTIIQIVSVYHGNGRHRVYISDEDYQYVNFLTWMTQIFLFLNIGLLKCSICILILRIKNTPVLNWCLYIMMAGLILTNMECVLVLLAECSPVEKYWHPDVPGKCWDTKVRIYSIYLQVGYSVVTDLICTLLPIVVLWKVQMKRSLKIAVCGLMSLGLIATATAIVRASSLGTTTSDLTYAYCMAAIYGNTELHLGIIAANLSLSRSIYGYFMGRNRDGTSGASGSVFPTIGSKGSRGFPLNSNSDQQPRRGRKNSEVGSESSQMELGDHVVKTTEFRLEEESVEREGGMERDRVTRMSWDQKPMPKRGFHGGRVSGGG
ncbi:hypothetical protein VE01_10608 [Pseudogymnoascus verrucosus]|uniref:Rhodopsin domain-containing protein n=1 Tax=Pseudogymnoascus verrucosus TaxID=342668 RepID=A0A1B8G6F4_9PEZI|nr:uncharacterized protein VE01_10608 [Pseudogymnoascus verrucosus]OBT91413.1 hypothetical protein VE01_10608 [Pseudogymnoascus verrucosus]